MHSFELQLAALGKLDVVAISFKPTINKAIIPIKPPRNEIFNQELGHTES